MIKIGNSASNISIYTCQPKDKKELLNIIVERIKLEGLNCDLNDIDVSKITDMSRLFFFCSKFDGDISKWNVSNVKDMSTMFSFSKFNGDISKWDVSNVKNMTGMFNCSRFNTDISKWNVSKVENMSHMFEESDFNSDISKWDMSNVEDMQMMFNKSKFNQDISGWNVKKGCWIYAAFDNCPIKEEFKPKVFENQGDYVTKFMLKPGALKTHWS